MRKRPEIPKHLAKVHARKLLERQEQADVYEKGLQDAAKLFAAGSFFPADVAEGVTQKAFIPPASYKFSRMRPPVPSDYQIDEKTGKPVFKGKPPVVNPEYKGTTEHVGKLLGVDVTGPGAIAPQVFSPDPFAKAHAAAMGAKLLAGKLGGLGALFGGLKKVGKSEDVAKPIFTSPGKSAAADISKETIPANKVKNQLEGRGVSKDEMEWTGFNDWIKTKKGEVSKAEIEEFFEQNQIQVQEVVYGDYPPEVQDLFEELLAKNEGRVYDQWDEADQDLWMQKRGPPRNVRYPQKDLQLPGGENYRELLLRVPAKQVPWTKENIVPISAEEAAEIQSGIPNHNRWFFKTPDGVLTSRLKSQNKPTDQLVFQEEGLMPPSQPVTQEKALQQVLEGQPDPKPRFTGGHWDESDVIAHIRFNERVDPDGNKVLFIEEIQSDWAHKGKDVGFSTGLDAATENKLKKELAQKRTQLEDAAKKYFGGISEPGREVNDLLHTINVNTQSDFAKYLGVSNDEASRVFNLPMEMGALDNRLAGTGQGSGVQPGPFVTDAHQWTNLALKRMIRWGSDEGFDSIAWVTGKQSADRYKVSKQISEVQLNGTDFTAFDHSGNAVIQRTGVRKEDLPELIGKEPARKLMEQPNTAPGTSYMQQRKLSGLDLDIGGEYHKFIYDKVITDQAKKIGKKHGAKVEEGSIGSTELINDYQAHINKLQKRLDEEQLPKRTRSDFKHAIEYHKERLLEERENIKKVWSMRLTDKLKQASKDGMPYYVALPPLVMGAAAQRTDAQRQQSKTDAQAILTQ